jgi:phosphoglycolate phosphatase-like HAD superfamily hydrolase
MNRKSYSNAGVGGMNVSAQFYRRWREEILAASSLVVPALAAIMYTRVLTPAAKEHLRHHTFMYILATLVLLLIGYAAILRKQVRASHLILQPIPTDERHRHQDVIDWCTGIYYLLGMSAEEFQRNVPLKDVLLFRNQCGQPIRELRFLLLHPDSSYFGERLLEVNPSCNVKALIERKKDLIRSLHLDLISLPAGVVDKFEIRFFDSYPVWYMQFYSSTPISPSTPTSPDALILGFHPKGKHSKYSPQYRIEAKENGIFSAFLSSYDRMWQVSMPMQPDGSFPKIYSPERERIKLIAFDLDGTIIESTEAKRAAFLGAFGSLKVEQRKRLTDLHRQREGLPRSELFRVAQRILDGAGPHKSIEDLCNQFSAAYMATIDNLTLVDGFQKFLSLFESKFRFAIISNAPLEEVEEILRRKNVRERFSYVGGAPMTKAEAFRELLRTAGLEEGNVLYVGDTEEDRAVCSTLNIQFVARTRPEADWLLLDPARSFRTYEEFAKLVFAIEAERSTSLSPRLRLATK